MRTAWDIPFPHPVTSCLQALLQTCVKHSESRFGCERHLRELLPSPGSLPGCYHQHHARNLGILLHISLSLKLRCQSITVLLPPSLFLAPSPPFDVVLPLGGCLGTYLPSCLWCLLHCILLKTSSSGHTAWPQ